MLYTVDVRLNGRLDAEVINQTHQCQNPPPSPTEGGIPVVPCIVAACLPAYTHARDTDIPTGRNNLVLCVIYGTRLRVQAFEWVLRLKDCSKWL